MQSTNARCAALRLPLASRNADRLSPQSTSGKANATMPIAHFGTILSAENRAPSASTPTPANIAQSMINTKADMLSSNQRCCGSLGRSLLRTAASLQVGSFFLRFAYSQRFGGLYDLADFR